MLSIGEIFSKSLSCRSPLNGNFANYYDNHLSRLREKSINVLEVGVREGYGLQGLQEAFPNANLYGLDIVHKDMPNVYQADSTDRLQVSRLFEQPFFDVIIEDGGTLQSDKIRTLQNLWDFLNPNGFYFIEHLQHSYESKNNGGTNQPDTIVSFLKQLIDEIHFYGIAEKGYPFDRGDYKKILDNLPSNSTLTKFQMELEFVAFYHGLAVLKKRK